MTPPLPSPGEINRDRNRTSIESQNRSNALAAEESRLTKLINLAKDRAKDEIKKIEIDFQEYIKELEVRKDPLKREVESLEARRTEALKPIDEIRAKTEETLKEAERILSDAQTEAENVAMGKERNQEIAEDLKDKQHNLDEREIGIGSKERANRAEAELLKKSTETLGEKWVAYHKASEDFNRRVIENNEREANLEIREKAVIDRESEQNDRQRIQDDRDTELKDKYKSLQNARDEIFGRKT